MSLIKTLKDNEGNTIYPQSSTSAIYNAEGKTLDETIGDIETILTTLTSGSGVA